MSRAWGAHGSTVAGRPVESGVRVALSGARAELARRQAELVATLVAGGPPPPGFDEARLAATRRALLRKRAGEARHSWPLLVAALGPDWPAVFARHRAGAPPVGGLRDGWDVARALRAAATLPAAAAVELAEREAVLRYDGRSAPRPRRLGRLRAALVTQRAQVRRRLRHNPDAGTSP